MTRLIVLLAFVLLGACATIPEGGQTPAGHSHALDRPELTRLGREAADMAAGREGLSGFRILTRGVDGFLARAHLIASAQRTLDLQYYIFRQDDTGQLLTELLLRAADRGVRLRLLVDDGDTVAGDEQLELLAAHPMIEVRVFNPFRYRGHSSVVRLAELTMGGGHLDFRMHNKLLAADNAAALVGGRNIGDQYFQTDPAGQLGDDDVLAIGPVVRELSGSFDEFWNSGLPVPMRADRPDEHAQERLVQLRLRLARHHAGLDWSGAAYLRGFASAITEDGLLPLAQGAVWAHATLVADSPDKRRVESGERGGRLMQPKVAQASGEVRDELLIITPYLIPGIDGMNLLQTLRQQGVRVRILTNSLTSTPELLAHAGYLHYRRPLLAAGVELFEVRNAPQDARGTGEPRAMMRHGNYGLHAKLFVFDRKRLFVGSMNFDQRSRTLNTELGLIIDSPELAAQTAARFEAITSPDNSYAVALKSPQTGGEPILVWRTREAGKLVEYDDEPARSVWQRLELDWLSLVRVDGEL